MDKNKKPISCSDCNKEFKENDIAYICDKCGAQYCFKCFCKNHFEKHSNWQPGVIKDGKLEPTSPERIIPD
ncbi:hypothetical protein DSECCO2_395940 [anaerobic digester metagenome]